MTKIDFYDKVKQARDENQKVMCFIAIDRYSRYRLYFMRDILDTDISLADYDYEEIKGVEFVIVELKEDKFVQTKVGIEQVTLNWLIENSTITDFDQDSKTIINRFLMYLSYLIQASSSSSIDLHVFLYIYAESMYTQRQIASQLGVSINSLYDQTSINEIRPLNKRARLLKCESLKYTYLAMVYINIYTFDVYLQLYIHPNMDVLLTDITSPVIGNLLVNIIPGDTFEQVLFQFVNFRSDFGNMITKHTIQTQRTDPR